jgi:hypothetical protein
MNLKLYGNKYSKTLSLFYILKFKLNPDGFFFKKDEFVIYILVNGDKHEGIIFDNKKILHKFEDVMIEGTKFIRFMDKYIIHIDNFDIKYYDRLMHNSFISPSKPNVNLSKKKL